MSLVTEKDHPAAGTGHLQLSIEPRAIYAYRLAIHKYRGLLLPFQGLQGFRGGPNHLRRGFMAVSEMRQKVPGLAVSHPKKQGRIPMRRSHSPSYRPLAMII